MDFFCFWNLVNAKNQPTDQVSAFFLLGYRILHHFLIRSFTISVDDKKGQVPPNLVFGSMFFRCFCFLFLELDVYLASNLSSLRHLFKQCVTLYYFVFCAVANFAFVP